MNQKERKKSSRPGRGTPQITKTEAEILGLFTSGLNAAQIAAKRQSSHSYIARVLKRLYEKGMVQAPVQGVGYTHELYEPKSMENNFLKRVHAQRFTFNIVRVGSRFRPVGAQHLRDGTFVQVSEKKLYVMAAKDRVFTGEDLDSALRSAIDWWGRRFSQIEADLDCVFWKDRRVFDISYTEVASEGSEVASCVMQKEGHVRVFSDKDNKLRLSFDMSKGRPEHEVHRAKSWRADSNAADRHFNAILDYGEGPTLPQLAQATHELQLVMKSQVEAMNRLIERSIPPEFVSSSDRPDYFN